MTIFSTFFASLVFYLSRYVIAWDISMTYAEKPLSNHTTLAELVKRSMLTYSENTCLIQTERVGHCDDVAVTYDAQKHNLKLTGTTIWINDWFAPGHVFFIISHIQALAVTHIDRIVIQRPPCWRADFCTGIGYYRSFFQLFFSTAIDTFQPNVSFYMRWHENDKVWRPIDLHAQSLSVTGEYLSETAINSMRILSKIPVKPITCFDKVIGRIGCNTCAQNSWSSDTINRFRNAAVSKACNEQNVSNCSIFPSFFPKDAPINIALVYRGTAASRHMTNANEVFAYLQEKINLLNSQISENSLNSTNGSPKFRLTAFDSSTNNRTAAEQVLFVRSQQIIICEHGAFQANSGTEH